jgi:hypothetical protein
MMLGGEQTGFTDCFGPVPVAPVGGIDTSHGREPVVDESWKIQKPRQGRLNLAAAWDSIAPFGGSGRWETPEYHGLAPVASISRPYGPFRE